MALVTVMQRIPAHILHASFSDYKPVYASCLSLAAWDW